MLFMGITIKGIILTEERKMQVKGGGKQFNLQVVALGVLKEGSFSLKGGGSLYLVASD